jgi:NAD(P)-dependent dehydrogenase (short-subunit alcohol dehydrogenase family)
MQKTAVVTGASNGIGKITALTLDNLGYRVLLVVRNRQKGQEVLEHCKNAQMFVADLSLVQQTLRVAEEIKASAPQIDVLVNNAGAIFNQRLETAEGLEMTFALNHMGYFVLTTTLMPNFAQGVRVVNVSSDAHRTGAIVWDDLQGKRQYNGFAAYCRSKAMNVLFSNELARRLHDYPRKRCRNDAALGYKPRCGGRNRLVLGQKTSHCPKHACTRPDRSKTPLARVRADFGFTLRTSVPVD